MFRKRILLLFFWSIIIHHTGISQDVKFFRPEGDISQNTITSIVQDAKGFLWFGTQHGLNQYNGVEFKSYFHHLDEEEGLSNSAIGCLYAGTEGNLWIGTLGGGLSQFNIYNQSFIPIHTNIKAPISDHIIHTLYEDRDGDLWMGTEENGLKLWDRKKQTLHHFFFEADKKNTIGANHVRAITQDKDGIIWIANWDGGFFLFHKEKELFTKLEGFPQEITARTIHQGQDNKLWLGTEQGIACFLQDERRLVFDEVLQRAIGTYTVLSIVESQDAKLWISTENNGLFLFDTQTKAIQNFTYDPKDHYSIQNNSVWCIFEDRQQTLWVGLFKSGINKVDPFEQKFNHITDGPESKLNLSYGLVSSFAEDESGNLWVGTDGGGLSFIDKAEDQLFIKNYNPSSDPPLGSKEIVDIATDHRDQLWIGTWGEGLFIKNKQNEFRNIVHDPDNINSPSGNDIMRLHRDAFNHMWIATHRIGMDLYVPDTEQFYHFVPSANANSISLDKILAIASHPKGYVWLGSEDGGLDRVQLADDYTLQEVKTYKYHTEVAQGLVRNGINDLYLDSKDRLWIATDGGGLNRLDDLDGDKFELLTTKDGLPSNVVYGILEESSEVFWVSTNAGLARIDLAKQEVRVFDLADGLQAREFTRGACYKTKDNTFLFGGINGYNYFNPKDIQHNTLVPPVYITDLTIQTNDPESISPQEIRQQLEGRAVSLAADENDIAIEFAALNYSQASKNQYFFKLENYDSRWRDGKNNNTATYTNIPPGNYTFKVKASNNDGVWNEQPTTLKITIRPPWYQTWWAYLLFVLLLGGSLLGIFRILIQR
ncbi:MAG: two-component regulator propeller domain-containing protein, partial [Bacteroidota bacterium]